MSARRPRAAADVRAQAPACLVPRSSGGPLVAQPGEQRVADELGRQGAGRLVPAVTVPDLERAAGNTGVEDRGARRHRRRSPRRLASAGSSVTTPAGRTESRSPLRSLWPPGRARTSANPPSADESASVTSGAAETRATTGRGSCGSGVMPPPSNAVGLRPACSAAAALRDGSSSLRRMFWTWRLTVNTEISSSPAISRFRRPAATSSSTCRSRSESSDSRARCASCARCTAATSRPASSGSSAGSPIEHAAQRTEQLGRADRLRDEAERACRDRGEDVLGRRPERPDERGNGPCLLRQALERVRAAERRQLEIDDGDVGGLGRHQCEELVEIPCFADGECPVPLGHDAQAGAEDRRGVGHDDKRSCHATGPPAPAKLRPGLAAWPLSEAVWP